MRGVFCFDLTSGRAVRKKGITSPSLESSEASETTESEEVEKEVLYYLSDGIYGSFNNIVSVT